MENSQTEKQVLKACALGDFQFTYGHNNISGLSKLVSMDMLKLTLAGIRILN